MGLAQTAESIVSITRRRGRESRNGTLLAMDLQYIYDQDSYVQDVIDHTSFFDPIINVEESDGWTGATMRLIQNTVRENTSSNTIQGEDKSYIAGAESPSHLGSLEQGRHSLRSHSIFAKGGMHAFIHCLAAF